MCPKSTSSGKGNGTPLQCSCLEHPRDGGAWWAAAYGVAQSWTQLKRLSSSTSRLPFGNIARSPETVPPPTVFLQVSAPNLIAGSSTFEEFFGLLLINSLTDDPLVKRRYSSFMFTAARDSHVGEREQAEPPQACDPPFWVERIGCPAQDDV